MPGVGQVATKGSYLTPAWPGAVSWARGRADGSEAISWGMDRERPWEPAEAVDRRGNAGSFLSRLDKEETRGMQGWIGAVNRALQRQQSVALVTVLGQSGSTPRGAGAWMIVFPDGKILGTIGGGVVEAQVIAGAKKVFVDGRAVIKRFELNADMDEGAAMACGGGMQVLIEACLAQSDKARIVALLAEELRRRRPSVLVRELVESPAGAWDVHWSWAGEKEAEVAMAGLPAGLKGEMDTALAGRSKPGLCHVDGRRFFIQPCLPTSRLYLFGAGHVAAEVAALAARVGFSATVVDDRPVFASRDRFPDAEEIRVVNDFEQAVDGLEIDETTFVVILTHGHSHDRTVLRRVLTTGAGYIGMIGSTRKRDAIYASLKREGIRDQVLERVHCPIGLPIQAQTPGEIAVSIVAELIRERASRDRP